MQEAIALAENARYHSPPNPWVGCVIVKEGKIIGKGYTQPPGQAHAEICALQQAQENAKNGKLYTTLEPCSHVGRTPPCTEAIIRAGIREVYFGVQDPDPRVSGNGLHLLQQAGIKVYRGICQDEIHKMLAPYLYQRQTGLPFTILKSAISLDGRTAAANLSSQWITCTESRQDVHLRRASSQAIVIGAGTALKDSPQLTVRHPECAPLHPPLRVLLDAKGQVPAKGPLFDCQLAPTLVITTSQCPQNRQMEWTASGAEVAIVSQSAEGVNLYEAWSLLGKRNILQVLVEGGSSLLTSLLETSLCNRLVIYIGPLLLGASGFPLYRKHIAALEQSYRLSLIDVKKIGECVRMEYDLNMKSN